jgi:predicted nucleotidyltransferase
MNQLDLKSAHMETVCAILSRHLAGREVRAFGSRVRGVAKPYSDLDLALLGEQLQLLSNLTDLADNFTESVLHFKVDIVDWATTNESFRKVIAAEHLILQEPDARAAR